MTPLGWNAPVVYVWSNGFDHAQVKWGGRVVADMVLMEPLWYVISDHAFLRFRKEWDARRHVEKAIDRVARRLRRGSETECVSRSST